MEEQGKGKRILILSLKVLLGMFVMWLLGYLVYVFAVI